MTEYEEMEQEAFDEGVNIDYVTFRSPRIKGLYCDGSIAISTKLRTSAERSCILAEELGHYHTSAGNILSLDAVSRKQERIARLWAYNRQVGLTGIVRAFEAGCRSLYEMAEHLGVTEAFLREAIEAYKQKYAPAVSVGDYTILFRDGLTIIKRI